MANDHCYFKSYLTKSKITHKWTSETKKCSRKIYFNNSSTHARRLVTVNLLNSLTMLSVTLLISILFTPVASGEAFNGFISGPILNSSSMFTSLALPDDSFDEPIMSDESLPQPQALRLSLSNSNDKAQLPEISLPTVTVRGFLNFRTTVDGTVVVFTSSATSPGSLTSPSSSLPSSTSKPPLIVPTPTTTTSTATVNPYHSYSSAYYDEPPSPIYSPILGSPYNGGKSNYFYKTQIHNNNDDHQEVTITPTSSSSSYSAVYPTGLVTILAETELGNNGETTVQETKVIGTYIEGKYAQILKSTSFVNLGHSTASHTTPTPVISSDIFAVYPSQEVPSPVLPSSSSLDKQQAKRGPVLEEGKFKFESSNEKNSDLVTRFTRGDRPQGLFGSSRPSPFKFTTTSSTTPTSPPKNGESTSETPRVKIRKLGRLGQGSSRFTWTPRANEKVRLNRFKVKVTAENANPTSRFTARDENEKEAARVLNARLNRRLGSSRTLTTEKPNANIEPPTSGSSASATVPFTESPEALTLSKEGGPGDFSTGESKKATYKNAPLIEGLLSEGSSPAGSPFYSPGSGGRGGPHEFAGSGQIRPSKVIAETVTFTSDVTRGFEGGEPLIEKMTLTNVIEKTIELDPVSESLVQPTLLTGNLFIGPMATPPIILSHTYEVTSSTSRTSLLPLASDSTATVTENFVIRKFITAYKTLPNSVGEASDLVSSLMSEMNNSAYLDTLLAASSVENQIEPTVAPASIGDMATLISSPTQGHGKVNSLNPSDDSARLPVQLLPSLNSAIGPQIDLNNPLILGAALQNPTLAAMYFGLQQLSQQVTQYTTILKPTEVPSTETIYSTKTVSFYDGRQTRTRTITEPASTTIKMISTVTPQVQPVINPQILVQQAQLQRAFASQLLNSQSNNNNNNFNNNNGNNNGNNGLLSGLVNNNVLSGLLGGQNNNLHQQQQQFANQLNVNNLPIVASVPQISPSTVTETTVTLITTTSTSSKIYTLIYNAFSTKYRTVTSTTVYPTQITTTITKTITPSATGYPFFG